MMYEVVGLGIAFGIWTILLWCVVKNHGVAIETLDEMANGLSSLHTATLLQSELAFAQRERLIEAIAAIPVRPPLATVGHVAPGGARGNVSITSIPSPTPVRTPTSAPPQMDQPAFPKALKKVEDEDWPRAHHSGPPSPMHVPPAFPKPLKKVDEDWPQHD